MKGSVGQREIQYEVTYKNGIETSRQKIGEEVILQPVDRVIEVGTKVEPKATSKPAASKQPAASATPAPTKTDDTLNNDGLRIKVPTIAQIHAAESWAEHKKLSLIHI